jgi:hypothetical protein
MQENAENAYIFWILGLQFNGTCQSNPKKFHHFSRLKTKNDADEMEHQIKLTELT